MVDSERAVPAKLAWLAGAIGLVVLAGLFLGWVLRPRTVELGSIRPEMIVVSAEPGAKTTFAVGATEVTQRQWRAVMGRNPSYTSGAALDEPLLAVQRVSRFDAIAYLNRLTEMEDDALVPCYRLSCDGALGSGCSPSERVCEGPSCTVEKISDCTGYRFLTDAECQHARLSVARGIRGTSDVWEWVDGADAAIDRCAGGSPDGMNQPGLVFGAAERNAQIGFRPARTWTSTLSPQGDL